MLAKLNQSFQQLANRRAFLVLLAAYCIYFPIFFFANVPFGITAIRPYAAGAEILDVELFYTAEQAYERLALFGEQGRAVYLHILMGDLIYPALLGSLLAVSISLIVRRIHLSNAAWQHVVLLPLANMVFDYCENAMLFSLLLSYPTRLPLVATAAGAFTFTKNVFGMLSFVVLACGVLAMLFRWFRPHHA